MKYLKIYTELEDYNDDKSSFVEDQIIVLIPKLPKKQAIKFFVYEG